MRLILLFYAQFLFSISMDILWAINTRKQCFRKFPDRSFLNYYSQSVAQTPVGPNGLNSSWVTCRFSPHSEHLLYLGDDDGNVGIVDVRGVYGSAIDAKAGVLQYFAAHKGTITDVMGVPHSPNELLSISGDTNVRIWDLQQEKSTLYFGHDMTVRSASFAPDSPYTFVTGGRDGQIRVWDTRTSYIRNRGQEVKKPVNVYRNAHIIKNTCNTSRRRSNCRHSIKLEKTDPPSVTSVSYINDYIIVSASSNAKSGIRMWDSRKMSIKEEGQVLSTLHVPLSKDAGVTSLCLDRFGSSLFAAVTDNYVYEYAVTTTNTMPIRHFSGATIESFYVQVNASPICDQIICGSTNNQAVIWDLQDFHKFLDDSCDVGTERRSKAHLPKFTLNGHSREVTSVGWSAGGTYMVSMDDDCFRIWSPGNISDKSYMENRLIQFEKIEPYNMTCSEKTTAMVGGMSITSRPVARMYLSPRKSMLDQESLRKRKEPFISPLKKISALSRSPHNKIIKLSSPVLPLSNVTNKSSLKTAHRWRPSQITVSPQKPLNVFHSRFPTEDLPNFVYERYVQNLTNGENVRPFHGREILAKKNAKVVVTIEDWWSRNHNESGRSERLSRVRVPSVSEFKESVCSKMIAEQERVLRNSPRKLTVRRTPLKKSVEAVKELNNCSRRRSSRNLLDYFSKKDQ